MKVVLTTPFDFNDITHINKDHLQNLPTFYTPVTFLMQLVPEHTRTTYMSKTISVGKWLQDWAIRMEASFYP